MLATVLDRHFNKVAVFEFADNNNRRFTVTADTQQISISDGVMLSTFTATFSKNKEESQYLTIGNYIAFKDEWGKLWCFVINEITNETPSTREIYCEDLGLDLLNSASVIYEANQEQPIEYYLQRELFDTGWDIGLNEIKTKKRVSFDESSTTLRRLQDIAKAFECEIYFDIEFSGRAISKQKVNVVKQIGNSKPNKRLTNGQEITAFSKNINIKELKTACYAYGANGANIADISYNDGRFKSNWGSNLIVDMDASNRWNRFPNKSKNQNGYYEMVNNSDSEDITVILNDGIKALKEKNEPQATYSASIAFKAGKDISIGDCVQLVDPDFNPALFLEARISSISVSRTSPSSNTLEISNAKEIDGGISERIKSLQQHQNALIQSSKNNISIKILQHIDSGVLTLSAQVYRGSEDITDEFTDTDFSWKRQTISGADEEFNSQHYAVGSTITVDLNTVDRRDIFECYLLVHPFQLVAVSWFQNGLREIANKIEQYREEDSSVVIFATDIHQALTTLKRDNAMIFSQSNNHIKNVAELTHMVDVDLVVLGGDIADGSTSKDQQVEALKQVISTAKLSNSTVLACKGNHDDNSWYARSLAGIQWDLRNVIMPGEMNQILIDPIRYQNGVHVTDFQTAYVDINNIRHIILNSVDLPYTLNSNGNPMFPAINSMGYSSQQLAWLISTLKSTPDDYQVCFYQHHSYGYTYSSSYSSSNYNMEPMMEILNAFQHHKKAKIYNDDPNFTTNLVADFTNNKATILYGAHGHHHNDKLMKWNDINFISTGCSAPIPRHLDGTGLLDDRELYTLKEDVFDVLIITPSKKQIKILRFGAGKDREIKL